jgi:hypothetical protein
MSILSFFNFTFSSKLQRATLKEKWLTLDEKEKIPYQKKARDHLAKQGLMTECITDALRKEAGGNCSRSYASLAKVIFDGPYP